jgi:hypothetical protein
MDYPRRSPPGPAFLLFERRIAPVLLVLAIVFAVAIVPVFILYWAGLGRQEADRQVAAERTRASWRSLDVPPARSVLFRSVNVVPMDGEHVLTGRDVLVDRGRIVAIAETGTLAASAAAVVEGQGRFLMPGLIDMHVHLPTDSAGQESMLEVLAANGVTTVLNLRGTPAHLRLRETVERGDVVGPTVYTSGPYISNAPFFSPSPEEAAAAVREQKKAGYDVIKIHGDFSRDAYRSVIRAARRARLKVVGHAPRNIGMDPIFEERQDALAHVEEFIYAYYRFGRNERGVPADADSLTRSVAARTRAAGVQVIANLTAYHGIWKQAEDVRPLLARPEMAYVPAAIRDDWQPDRNTYVRRFGGSPRPFEEWYGLLRKLVAALDGADVPLMAGTDTPIPCVVPGFSLHDEVQDLVAAGLTPYRALRAATIAPARFLDENGAFGTVGESKRADLILVERNPLEDVRAVARPAGVMLRGRWLDRKALDARLAAVAEYARY